MIVNILTYNTYDSEMVFSLLDPNFNITKAVITERRIRLLREASQSFSLKTTSTSFFRRVCKATSRNPIDLPLVVFYDCSIDEDPPHSSHETPTHQSSSASEVDEPAGYLQSTMNADFANSNLSEGPQYINADITYTRAAITGSHYDSKIFPPEIPPYSADNDKEASIAMYPSFRERLREVQRTHRALVLRGEMLAEYAEYLDKTCLGDSIACLVIMPILTMDNNLRAVAILGLNPRTPFDDDYQVFLDLFQAQVSHGITSIRLVKEEIRRSRFLAALIKRKNEELHQLLSARTEELRSSELKFLKMAEVNPAGIWTANLE